MQIQNDENYYYYFFFIPSTLDNPTRERSPQTGNTPPTPHIHTLGNNCSQHLSLSALRTRELVAAIPDTLGSFAAVLRTKFVLPAFTLKKWEQTREENKSPVVIPPLINCGFGIIIARLVGATETKNKITLTHFCSKSLYFMHLLSWYSVVHLSYIWW